MVQFGIVKPGGTGIPERRSLAPLLAFLVIAPLSTYAVHELSSGSECGWSWSAVGGACRAILLLSVLCGLVAGGLAVGCVRALSDKRQGRALTFGALVGIAIVLGVLGAKQFQDYRHAVPHTAPR